MTDRNKRTAMIIARTGVWAIGDIVALVLKIAGTVVLTALTTGAIFACIFVIYLRTNLATGLDVNPATFDMSLSSVIYYIDKETGQERELVTLQSLEFRLWVNYEDIPEHMIQALVAIEDHRFYDHQGVDWYRTGGAFLNMFLSMRDTFGGSTITQQLIKNLTHDDDTTVQRKMLEIFRALEFERQYQKEEIIEWYLNFVYFGHGRYGIGAAADYYFGKEVSELTVAESAAIIGITNNPSRFSPYADRTANKERQETILFRMHELGYIETEREYRRALNQNLEFRRGEHSVREEVVYTWFEEAIIADVIRDLMALEGHSEQQARRILFTNGLRIISTIDLEIQEIVDQTYTNPDSLPNVTGSAQPLQSGIVIADPYTGEIKALSGGVGRKRANILLNRATGTRRPPGSAIKPISVYAPAMEHGFITPETRFNDSAHSSLTGTNWMPRNADRSYSGMVTVRTALRRSLNTVSALALDKMGVSISYQFMKESLGFNLHADDENYAPLAAGQLTYGATVREMASAFTIFPNGGERAELRTYSRIYDSTGAILIDNAPQYTNAISESTAYWMTDMLLDAVRSGTGTAANLGNNYPTAGKTGTSTDSKDRWFVGFTPYYIAAVWTGFDMPVPMNSSGNPAAQIFRQIMLPIHEGLLPRQFVRPDDVNLPPPVQSTNNVEYIIRGIALDGRIVYESVESAPLGTELVVSAPPLTGYTIDGSTSWHMTLGEDPMMNIALFIYVELYPSYTEDPVDTPDPPEETQPPTDDDPPTDPPTEPPPTDDPPTDPPPPEPPPPEDPPPEDPPETE